MPDPLFVVGSPRSGTTLLRVMLAGHPQLFAPPEMMLAPFATMTERRARLEQRFWEKGGLRRTIMELEGVGVDEAKAIEATLEPRTIPEVYAWLQERIGDRVLVDKCPHLAADPPALDRLTRWFPRARWLWIVRHPGSVTRSIENMPMAEVMLEGYATDVRDLWRATNRGLRDFLAGIPADRQARLRYEDLVTDPEPTLRTVCEQLGVPFHEAMLTPYEGERMREGPSGARAVGDPTMAGRGRIQPELATSWLEGFDAAGVSPETHALARELGYDLGALEPPRIAAVSGALEALVSTARRLETGIRMPADLDDVEGRRFLLRMLSASIDLFVEEGDVDRPRFHHAEGPTRKMFADNPDADYWRAPLRLGGGRRYRISGHVPPGTAYVGLLLYRKGGVCGGHRHDREFVGTDGRFSLTVAAEPGADLVGEGDEIAVMVRQYFHDRRREPPVSLAIELVDGPPPRPLEAARLAKSIDLARRNLEAVFTRTVGTWQHTARAVPNVFTVMDGPLLFPTPDNVYVGCRWRIGGDQMLVVRGRVPRGRWWGVCLYNAWLESLDYRSHRICLNDRTLRTEADGSYEFCLAHRDPGHPNWLDTAGHHAGYVLLRALLPEDAVEPPAARVLYEREWPGAGA